jgi:hypothetical protein
LLTLSRAFLTLPCPFLCAMKLSGCFGIVGFRLLRLGSFSAKADARDLDARQLAAVPDGAVITFSPAVLERDDLLVLALLDHFAGNGRAFDERAAMGELVAVTVKEDVAKDGFLAGIAFEQIDIDDIALRDAMLSAACFDNCVSHTKSRVNASGEKPRKVPQMGGFDKGKLLQAGTPFRGVRLLVSTRVFTK